MPLRSPPDCGLCPPPAPPPPGAGGRFHLWALALVMRDRKWQDGAALHKAVFSINISVGKEGSLFSSLEVEWVCLRNTALEDMGFVKPVSPIPGGVFASLSSHYQRRFPFIEGILGRALIMELVCDAFETWFWALSTIRQSSPEEKAILSFTSLVNFFVCLLLWNWFPCLCLFSAGHHSVHQQYHWHSQPAH